MGRSLVPFASDYSIVSENSGELNSNEECANDGGPYNYGDATTSSTEEDEFDVEEHPCCCAQQIISTLFGVILGFIALVLSPKQIYLPLACAQVSCSVF